MKMKKAIKRNGEKTSGMKSWRKAAKESWRKAGAAALGVALAETHERRKSEMALAWPSRQLKYASAIVTWAIYS
jgi:aryl-alcohol dehydrogenase-like predicted oxidoreductase